jgi:hypothetical protein
MFRFRCGLYVWISMAVGLSTFAVLIARRLLTAL